MYIKVDNIFSIFQTLIIWSTTGLNTGTNAILFNIFDFVLSSDLQNYTVDFFLKKINCIYIILLIIILFLQYQKVATDDLLITLKNESVLAVKWFRQNNINSDRFQAMVLQKQDKNSGTYSLDIDNKIRKCSYMRQLLAVLWTFELLHILIIYFLIT